METLIIKLKLKNQWVYVYFTMLRLYKNSTIIRYCVRVSEESLIKVWNESIEVGQIASTYVRKTFSYLIEEDVIRTKRIHTLDSDRWECWLGQRRPLDSSGRSWSSSMFGLSNFWLLPFMIHHFFSHPPTSFLKEFQSIYTFQIYVYFSNFSNAKPKNWIKLSNE